MKQVKIEYLSKMDTHFDDNNSQNPKYYAPSNMMIEIGDIVLVERYNDSMTVGQVTNIHNDVVMPIQKNSFNVLDVITNSCDTFQRAYNEVAKKRIKKEIDARVRELDKMAVYEQYAAYDEEFKQLLDEYKEKGGKTL